jgi:hypothetical protein
MLFFEAIPPQQEYQVANGIVPLRGEEQKTITYRTPKANQREER